MWSAALIRVAAEPCCLTELAQFASGERAPEAFQFALKARDFALVPRAPGEAESRLRLRHPAVPFGETQIAALFALDAIHRLYSSVGEKCLLERLIVVGLALGRTEVTSEKPVRKTRLQPVEGFGRQPATANSYRKKLAARARNRNCNFLA